jgi:hypothetical protein
MSEKFQRGRTAKVRLLMLAVAALTSVVTLPVTAAQAYPPLYGNDVSWPQCPAGVGSPRPGYGLPMPASTAKFVLIGLTDGPGFTTNPCLPTQVAWAKSHHVYTAGYAVATYPTTRQLTAYAHSGPYSTSTLLGKLRNTGYAEARYNVARIKASGLTTPMVWIDVEIYPFRPWHASTLYNRAVVQGLVLGYQRSGFRVGFYSTTTQWPSIVGRLNYTVPEWHTAGPRTMAVALSRCSEGSFQGGRIILAQWWTSGRDYDLTCPAYSSSGSLAYYFHKY